MPHKPRHPVEGCYEPPHAEGRIETRRSSGSSPCSGRYEPPHAEGRIETAAWPVHNSSDARGYEPPYAEGRIETSHRMAIDRQASALRTTSRRRAYRNMCFGFQAQTALMLRTTSRRRAYRNQYGECHHTAGARYEPPHAEGRIETTGSASGPSATTTGYEPPNAEGRIETSARVPLIASSSYEPPHAEGRIETGPNARDAEILEVMNHLTPKGV